MYFTAERIKRIADELLQLIHSNSVRIQEFKFKKGNFHGVTDPGLDSSDWNSFPAGNIWGGKDEHCWFRTEVTIPENFDGKAAAFEVKTGREDGWDALNPQFMIYINGRLIQGLDVNHREIILSDRASYGETYQIDLHAYSGMKEGNVSLDAFISVLDKEVERLYYNIKVPLDVALLLENEDKRRIDILGYLNDAVNIIDLRKPGSESFTESVKTANDFLEREFYGGYCGHKDVTALCVGHTHIDVAWLWTLAQTREKTARSFTTVLNLMKQYPEYIFMSSQPQLYKYIKEDHPEVYEEIKQRVKEGRWEPEGAMWLEADCNLSSGESLIRQLLFGTRFFKEEFGIESKILWLPDVFGYSAALPQILKKSGIAYFMTTKISWNEYNKMPYDTFMWRGIDGTEILTHYVTTKDLKEPGLNPHVTTYNGIINPSQVMGAWDRYQQKGLNNEVLISFGYGDGGGGPTKEMFENARRLEKGIPGCPRVKIGKSLDFFNGLEEKLSTNKKLPKWVGELYLEYHRGTYTSMARNKRFNRKCEFLYQDTELLSSMNTLAGEQGQYPHDRINQGWETILLNQFHDILPGSSIKEVYDESKEQYLDILEKGRNLVKEAVDNICSRISIEDASVVVFNQLGFERSDIVEFTLPEGCGTVEIKDIDGSTIPSQVVCPRFEAGESSKKAVFFAKNVPSKGYKSYGVTFNDISEGKSPLQAEDTSVGRGSTAKTNCKLQWGCKSHSELVKHKQKLRSNFCDFNTPGESPVGGPMEAAPSNLSNRYFDIKLDENCSISSIFDRVNNREVLQPGLKANVLQAFEDKPYNFDAWDINLYYQEKMWEVTGLESADVVENGPVRAGLKIKRKFLDSIIVQYIYIYNDLPRIDFVNFIDWKEKHILLKAAFPVDIHSDRASYEIQYGNVERPTHWNTSWDYARFEVCAHKWADLSEDGYGVSILNDCKYGHDIKDGVMRLTLLKSADYPNPDADREKHEFTYSLYPHGEGWRKAGTINMAYSLNCPMYSKLEPCHKGTLAPEFSLVWCNRENVVIEAVKKAEDSDGFIIRIYECHNKRAMAVLTFFKELGEAYECTPMEDNIKRLDITGSSLEFEIKPYEIKTFRIKL